MPYFTGTQADLAARLHQNLISGLDMQSPLTQYNIESGVYTGAPFTLQNAWAREINKKFYIFSGTPSTNG